MAGEYNSSVKFESRQAEAAITSFSGKINTLRNRLAGVSNNARTLDGALKNANRTMNSGASAANKIERGLLAVGRGSRSAASGMQGFIRSMNAGEMARGAGIIKSLSTHLTSAATRMRQISSASGTASKNFAQFGRNAVAAALGAESLGKRLSTVIPKLREAAALAGHLAGSLGTLRGRYVVVGTATDKAAASTRKMASSASGARSELDRYDRALARAEKSLLSLGSGLAGVRNLGLAWLTGMGISGLVEMADGFNLVQARLKLVTDGYMQANAAQSALIQSSNETRTAFRDNANLFVKMAQAGEAYGVSLQKSLQITENVNKAFKISGASTGEAQAASMQLAQGFASGLLQGDELRSILENAPRLGRALSEELGIPLGEIRKRAKEGEIGINEMVKAFGSASFSKKIAEEFKNIPITIGDSLTIAKNKVMEFIGSFDDATGTSTAISGVIVALANNLDSLALAAGLVGVAFTARYIPALVGAIKASREFAKVQLASQALAITSSFSNATSAVSLFSGVFRKSATSTLPVWKQVLGNVTAAVRLNVGSMGGLFRAFFTRLPGLAVIGTGAMMAFEDQTRISANGIATSQDYMVTGFQMMGKSIVDELSWIAGEVDRAMRQIVSDIMWAAQQAYSGFSAIVEGAIETGKQAGSGLQGKGFDTGAIGNAASRGWNRNLGADAKKTFGILTKGTAWERAANDRAIERFSEQGRNSQLWQTLMLQGSGSGLTPPPRASGGGGGRHGGGGKSDAERAAEEWERETERLKESILQMAGTFDEVEAKRNDFNEGLKTLNDAMAHGVINGERYKVMLDSLALNTFPGLKDQIADLAKENENLFAKLNGASDQDIQYNEGADIINKQVDAIDRIVAKQGDVNGVLGRQKQTLLDQLETYRGMLGYNKALQTEADKRAQKEQRINEIIQDGLEKTSEMFTNIIESMLSFKGNAFKNIFKGFFDMGKRMLAQFLSATVFAPIQDKLAKSLKNAMTSKQDKIGSAAKIPTLDIKDFKPEISINVGGSGGGATPTVSGGDVNLKVSSGDNAGNAAANDNNQDIVVTGRRYGTGFMASIAEGYGKQTKTTLADLGKLFKPVGKEIKKAAEKMGINTDKLGKGIGKALGGAQTGTMVAGLAKALGFKKFSTTGAQIGGAIGSFLPIPGGDIIGSIIGGTIGSLFKKNKQASASVSVNQFGVAGAGQATGRGSAQKGAANAMAASAVGMLGQVADALGVTLKAGARLPSIGVNKKGDYVVDLQGKNRLKSGDSNTPKFKTEEEALRAWLVAALKSGVLVGLSNLSNSVIKKMKDADRAIQLIQTVENIKKEFRALSNPMGAMFEDMKKDVEKVVSMYKEAGATATDWAELQTVITARFKDAVAAQLDTLTKFRADILGGDLSYKNAYDRLQFADAKFKEMEGKIARGEYVDQGTFTEAGTELSNLAREVYGSTPEFKVYQDRLLAATDALISMVQGEADKYKPLIDAIVAGANQTAAAQTGTNTRLDRLIQIGEQGGTGWGKYGYTFDNSLRAF